MHDSHPTIPYPIRDTINAFTCTVQSALKESSQVENVFSMKNSCEVDPLGNVGSCSTTALIKVYISRSNVQI